MKKVIALLMVCGFALAFVACGGKTETATTQDTTAVAPAVDTTAAPAADTTATDTTAAK